MPWILSFRMGMIQCKAGLSCCLQGQWAGSSALLHPPAVLCIIQAQLQPASALGMVLSSPLGCAGGQLQVRITLGKGSKASVWECEFAGWCSPFKSSPLYLVHQQILVSLLVPKMMCGPGFQAICKCSSNSFKEATSGVLF